MSRGPANLDPFKLRKDMSNSDVLFEVARKFFGEPNQYSVIRSRKAWPNGNNKKVLSWRVMDGFSQHTITVGHVNGSCAPDINWEQEHFNLGNCVSVNYSTFKSDWKDRIVCFIERIKKPWDDWTEDEFLEDPMWIYLFFKANGYVSDALHSAMMLCSYENPNNTYVKRYFKEWQGSPQRSSPG